MSADGGSITTQSPSPFSGESGSSTYYRETGWDAGFVSLGGSWKWLWWFGYYIDLGGGWIWHQQHKFMYTASTSASSLWFYDDSLDAWFWTSSSSYPYLFALQWSFDGVQTSAWCWYQVGSSNPRWYLRLSNGQWYRD